MVSGDFGVVVLLSWVVKIGVMAELSWEDCPFLLELALPPFDELAVSEYWARKFGFVGSNIYICSWMGQGLRKRVAFISRHLESMVLDPGAHALHARWLASQSKRFGVFISLHCPPILIFCRRVLMPFTEPR